jgi:uncharacterized protein (TIGR01777 family)
MEVTGDMRAKQETTATGGTMTRPTVAVTGSTGLVGRALVAALEAEGYAVRRLVRHAPRGPGEAAWQPTAATIDAGALDGAVAVVNLAGETIAQRWTAARRTRIVESRVKGTDLIARTIASMAGAKPALINASAVGIYGDGGDAVLDESSASGDGFLADVCRAWEGATAAARDSGARVVLARTGVVLSPDGGAMQRLLVPFRLGVGGRVGSGRQWMSWIALEDHVRALAHLVRSPTLSGAVNCTAPKPATNAEFTRAFARALRRPAVFPVPAMALRAVFGEMADETLLVSQRVVPTRLVADGFTFRQPDIDRALSSLV